MRIIGRPPILQAMSPLKSVLYSRNRSQDRQQEIARFDIAITVSEDTIFCPPGLFLFVCNLTDRGSDSLMEARLLPANPEPSALAFRNRPPGEWSTEHGGHQTFRFSETG